MGGEQQTTCNPAGDTLVVTSFSDDKCTAATGESVNYPVAMLNGKCEVTGVTGVTSSYMFACADGEYVVQSWANSSSCDGTPSAVTVRP